MRVRRLGCLLVLAGLLTMPSASLGQDRLPSGRVHGGLRAQVFDLISLSQDVPSGSGGLAGVPDTVSATETTTRGGLGLSGATLELGYLSGQFDLGASLGLGLTGVGQSVDGNDVAAADSAEVRASVNASYVAAMPSSIWPTAGLYLGLLHAGQSISDADGNTVSSGKNTFLQVGARAGLYNFVNDTLSIDLMAQGGFITSIDGGGRSGVMFGVTVGLSGWGEGSSGGAEDAAAPVPQATVQASAPAPALPSDEVVVVVDKKSGMQKVMTRLTMPGAVVVFGAVPERDDRVFVRVDSRSLRVSAADCEKLTLEVNDEPIEVANAVVTERKGRPSVAGDVPFTALRGLGKRYPKFGMQACGRPLGFGVLDTRQVVRFLRKTSKIGKSAALEDADAEPTQAPATEPTTPADPAATPAAVEPAPTAATPDDQDDAAPAAPSQAVPPAASTAAPPPAPAQLPAAAQQPAPASGATAPAETKP